MTFHLVAQCFNQLHHRVPLTELITNNKSHLKHLDMVVEVILASVIAIAAAAAAAGAATAAAVAAAAALVVVVLFLL